MLAALGMAWGWCQPSPVTFCPLRAAVAPPAAPERLPLTRSGARTPIFHTEPTPALSQTHAESPPERGPGRRGACTGYVPVVSGPVPECVSGGTGTGGPGVHSLSGWAASGQRRPYALSAALPAPPGRGRSTLRPPPPSPITVRAGSCSPANCAARGAAVAGDSRSQRAAGRRPGRAF